MRFHGLLGKPTNKIITTNDNQTYEAWNYTQEVNVFDPKALVPFLSANKPAGDTYQVNAQLTFGPDGGVTQYSREKRVDEFRIDPAVNSSSGMDNSGKSVKMPKGLRKLFY
jgi:hypothetical protein